MKSNKQIIEEVMEEVKDDMLEIGYNTKTDKPLYKEEVLIKKALNSALKQKDEIIKKLEDELYMQKGIKENYGKNMIGWQEKCGRLLKQLKQKDAEIINKVKFYNGSIKTTQDLLDFLERVTKCSWCRKTYWDCICPECVGKEFKQKDEIIQAKDRAYSKEIRRLTEKLENLKTDYNILKISLERNIKESKEWQMIAEVCQQKGCKQLEEIKKRAILASKNKNIQRSEGLFEAIEIIKKQEEIN